MLLFSCVVAQNIKQHSEEFENEGEEEVCGKSLELERVLLERKFINGGKFSLS